MYQNPTRLSPILSRESSASGVPRQAKNTVITLRYGVGNCAQAGQVIEVQNVRFWALCYYDTSLGAGRSRTCKCYHHERVSACGGG